MTEIAATESKARKGFRRKVIGKVTSDKMDKTVTVEVVRRYLAPLYKKYVRSRRRYHAHDPKNEYRVGDRVEISEVRRLSKTKRWIVTRMIAMSADREH
jgi:small subunit ribosomal protein S17